MHVSVKSAKGLVRRMRVKVPAEKIEKEITTRLKDVGRKAKIQGFRPGKVPAKIVQQRYGAQVRQEVIQDLLQSSYTDAVVQEDLKPAGSPSIEPENIKEGEGLTYTAVFEVFPEIVLKDLNKIKVNKPIVKIAEDDIDNMVQKLREQNAAYNKVDRKSAKGDRVTVNFEGKLKGESFDGGSAKDFQMVLGEGNMLEDFEKPIYGMNSGDTKSFKLKFPKDYHSNELAGKKVDFEVEITEVAEQTLPDIDEELIKKFGIATGLIDDLRSDVEKNLNRELAAKLKSAIRKQVLDGLMNKNSIDVPEVLVSQESESMQKEMMQRMGITDDAEAPKIETFREASEKRVRLGLLLNAAIQENAFQIDQSQINAKLDEICEPYDNPDEIRKIYQQNQQLINQIESVLLEEQVIEWMISQARLSDKAMTYNELMDLPS
ncbi:MAG: trigger factor [Pseudomonadota bacterium]|nr:trigger factor [Pseudomonadota bacterium]